MQAIRNTDKSRVISNGMPRWRYKISVKNTINNIKFHDEKVIIRTKKTNVNMSNAIYRLWTTALISSTGTSYIIYKHTQNLEEQ